MLPHGGELTRFPGVRREIVEWPKCRSATAVEGDFDTAEKLFVGKYCRDGAKRSGGGSRTYGLRRGGVAGWFLWSEAPGYKADDQSSYRSSGDPSAGRMNSVYGYFSWLAARERDDARSVPVLLDALVNAELLLRQTLGGKGRVGVFRRHLHDFAKHVDETRAPRFARRACSEMLLFGA